MIIELNYVLLNKIFEQASKNKKIRATKITEKEIVNKAEPIFISDDIRIYKYDNLLYIYLDNTEVLDNFFTIIKNKKIFENVDGVIITYYKSVEYQLDKIKLSKILRQINNNADKFLIKLMKLYDKDTSKQLAKIAIMDDLDKNEEDVIINNITDETLLQKINSGYQNILEYAKQIKVNIKNKLHKLLNKVFFKEDKI